MKGNNIRYRLSLQEHDTHKILGSIRFTKRRVIIAAVIAVILISTFYYSVIAFTPLRTTIPGYPNAHTRRTAIENAIRIDSLESTITRWAVYSESLDKVLAGEETIERDSLFAKGVTRYLSDKSAAQLAAKDSLLRSTVQQEERLSLGKDDKRPLPLRGILFFTPVKGVVSRGIDLPLYPGIDISAPSGSTVCSVLDGTVISTGWNGEEGYTIQIQHKSNLVSIYRHCLKSIYNAGDKVKAGTPVGLLGSSGTMEQGDFLHFELWYEGNAIDPEKYISF